MYDKHLERLEYEHEMKSVTDAQCVDDA